MVLYVRGDLVEHLSHLLGGGHRPELTARELYRQFQAPAVTAVDDRRRPSGADPREECRGSLDRALGRGETDALGRASGLKRLESLEGKRQVAPSCRVRARGSRRR